MANIGSRSGLEQELRAEIPQSVRGDAMPLGPADFPQETKAAAEPHRHRLWESLTASLDLACRGYLCMQVVDCDPVSDPDCGASGRKVVVRELPPQREQ